VGDISDEERRRIAEKFMRVGESAEEKNKRAVEEMFRGFGSRGFEDFMTRGVTQPSSPVAAAIVQCGGCGQKNRVKRDSGGQPRCGKCKKDLGVICDS
jgi:hypothetical protein